VKRVHSVPSWREFSDIIINGVEKFYKKGVLNFTSLVIFLFLKLFWFCNNRKSFHNAIWFGVLDPWRIGIADLDPRIRTFD